MKQMRLVTACGVFAIALLAAVGVDAAGRSDEPKVIEIHSKKFAYEPAEITLVKGVPYRLHLTSDDVAHSLRIKSLGLSGPMKPGEFSDVAFTPDQTGDFKADCGVYCGTGHTKMSLTVHVVEK
jgi:cytochrome c oxidase subunit II